MSSFVASGSMSGAASGAAAGTAIMPGIGTAVGAVLGGIAGALGGKQQDKRAKRLAQYKRHAAQITRHIKKKQMINETMAALSGVANAAAASGAGRNSSGVQGVLASVGTQGASNLQTTARMNRLSDAIGQAEADLAKPTIGDYFNLGAGIVKEVGGGIMEGLKTKDPTPQYIKPPDGYNTGDSVFIKR